MSKVETLKARYREVQRNPYLCLLESLENQIEKAIEGKDSKILLDVFKETKFGEQMWISSDRDDSHVTDLIRFVVLEVGKGIEEQVLVEMKHGGFIGTCGDDYVFIRAKREFVRSTEDESAAAPIILNHLQHLDIHIDTYPISRTVRGEQQFGVGVRLSWEHWPTK